MNNDTRTIPLDTKLLILGLLSFPFGPLDCGARDHHWQTAAGAIVTRQARLFAVLDVSRCLLHPFGARREHDHRRYATTLIVCFRPCRLTMRRRPFRTGTLRTEHATMSALRGRCR